MEIDLNTLTQLKDSLFRFFQLDGFRFVDSWNKNDKEQIEQLILFSKKILDEITD